MFPRQRLLPGLFVLATCLLWQGSLQAAENAAQTKARASEARLKKDLTFLASDECEGRGPTTRGINLAAEYIADQFKKAGLQPAGKNGSYFQFFTIPGAHLERQARLMLRGPQGQEIELQQGIHFHPMGLASSGAIKDAPVVFAGYGITGSKDFAYDDFAGIDVAGKIVVVLRDTPCATNNFVSIDGQRRRRHASIVEKMANAEKRNALAVLLVNDADTAADGDDLLDFNFTAASRVPTSGIDQREVKLPFFHLRRAVLDSLLKNSLARSLEEIEQDIDRELKPKSTALTGWTATVDLRVRRDGIELKNVIGVLEGNGPLAKETVVIGAHYDHLGYGGTSSRARIKKMAIHNGADDNASGTTAVIELARRFGEIPNRQGRRLVFMAFSGEELNLLGSAHYCKHPLFSLEDTVAMVNLDMVGRLSPDNSGKGKIQVYGTGTAKTFSDLIDLINKKYDFDIKKIASGFGPSDHSSFYQKKIPVFFFFTGDHPDYHCPSDDADKVNLAGMRKITDMVEELSAHLSTVKERPEYVRVTSGTRPTPGVRGPRLGFRPDYSDEKPGVLLGGITPGLPAAKAGLKEGDRIMEMNGKTVKNLEAYMLFMQTQKLGNTLELGILRDGKKQLVKVKLE